MQKRKVKYFNLNKINRIITKIWVISIIVKFVFKGAAHHSSPLSLTLNFRHEI